VWLDAVGWSLLVINQRRQPVCRSPHHRGDDRLAFHTHNNPGFNVLLGPALSASTIEQLLHRKV
jgi:hypothetical protein